MQFGLALLLLGLSAINAISGEILSMYNNMTEKKWKQEVERKRRSREKSETTGFSEC